jgi:hypothetical protein
MVVYFQWGTEGTTYVLHLKVLPRGSSNQNPVQGKHQASIKHKEPYSSDLHGLL